MWNYQTFDSEQTFSGFDSVEALQNANPIPDNFLNIKKTFNKAVQKKLDKKTEQINNVKETLGHAVKLTNAINAPVQAPDKPQQTTLQTADPITLQDAPNVPGSGLAMPISSGGGGSDMDYSESGTETDPGTISDSVLPGVTVTNGKTNYVLVAVVVFAVIGIILFLKRKK